MAKRVSRREFLGQTALVGATAAIAIEAKAAKGIPTRTLGKTGVKVPIVAMGCGSRLLAYEKEEEALAALNLALDLGLDAQAIESCMACAGPLAAQESSTFIPLTEALRIIAIAEARVPAA